MDQCEQVHHCEICKHLGSSKYSPALCLGYFASGEQRNSAPWGSREKRRRKLSPRIGIDIVGKSKCFRAAWPRFPPAPAPALPVLALREALLPLLGHSVVIFTIVQDASDSDNGAVAATASAGSSRRIWKTYCVPGPLQSSLGAFSLSDHYSNFTR